MKKVWIVVLVMVVIPGLLLTVSCKPRVNSEQGLSTKTRVSNDPNDPATLARIKEQKRTEAIKEQKRLEAIRQRDLEDHRRIQAITEQKKRENFEFSHIYFEFDSAVLTPHGQKNLREKAEWLRNNPSGRMMVEIEGHCDERGTNAYNLALGDRRSQSIKSFLEGMGVQTTMQTISYGEERPAKACHNESCWKFNRRVQFVIK